MDTKEEIILELKNIFSSTVNDVIANYWLNRLFGNRPNIDIWNENRTSNEIAIKRTNQILKDTDWRQLIKKYVHKKSKYGVAVIVIDKIQGMDGKPTIHLRVSESLIRYNKNLGTMSYVEVIENYKKGTIPLILKKRYGVNEDVLSFTLLDGFDMDTIQDKNEKKEIKEILKVSETISHNAGFVRAFVSINRADDNHWDFGQSDTNGFEEQISNIDFIDAKIINEIKKNATHALVNMGGGSAIGGDDSMNETLKAKMKQVETQYDGDVKVSYFDYQTGDGVDATIIPSNINIDPLRTEAQWRRRELFQDIGVQNGFDKEGTYNSTSNETDRIGDPANQEGTKRKGDEDAVWTSVFEGVMKLDEQEYWTGVDEIQFKVKVNDFRIKTIMMDKIDKLIKIMPLHNIIQEMDDVSSYEAGLMVQAKEQEVKDNLIGYTSVANGNIPQNIVVKGLEWADKKEETETTKNDEVETQEEE